MSKGHQHATNPPVNADECIVDVDSVQNNDTGNGSSTIDDGSAEGNPVNNVQNSDGGAVVQPDAAAAGVQADIGGGGGHVAPGDTNMRRSRSFEEDARDRRGWMMMVAALFVQMAFQAALQPPTWIPADWYRQYRSYQRKHGAAPSPSPHYAAAESPAAAIILTEDQADRVWYYVVFNTVTFATALTILVTLLLVNKSSGMQAIYNYVPVLFVIMALTCSATYILANSHEMHFMWWVLMIIALYAVATIFRFFWGPLCVGLFSRCFVTLPERPVTTRLFGR